MRLFAGLLHERTGQDLAVGRSWRVETALKPLLKARQIDSLDGLAATVSGGRDPALADAVVDALLNNETSFFRDPAAFRLLADGLGVIAEARATTRRLRIWCAGCSTGQEVYSLAMMLAVEPERWSGWTIELIGTDVSGAAITQARTGRYSQFEIQRGLPVREMMRWFEPEDEHWRIRPELRGRAHFQQHNLLDAAPARLRSDVILCRNVLLYLAPAKRRAVFARLAAGLSDDGLLMLGAGETVLGQTDMFEPDPVCRGLYRRATPPVGAAVRRVERAATRHVTL